MSFGAGQERDFHKLGWPAACRAYNVFLIDPVRALFMLHRRNGDFVGLPRLSLRGHANRINVLAVGPHFNRLVLSDRDAYRTTGATFYRGPVGSAMRRLRSGIIRMNGPEQAHRRRLFADALQGLDMTGAAERSAVIGEAVIDRQPRGTSLGLLALSRGIARRVSAEILFARDDPEWVFETADMIDRVLVDNVLNRAQEVPAHALGLAYLRARRGARSIEQRLLGWIGDGAGAQGPQPTLMSAIVSARDEDGAPLSLAERAAHLAVLFTASHDNVATTLCWTLFLLAQHPAVADRLLEEIVGIGGPSGAANTGPRPTPFLDAVVMESMRILPPVPYLLRTAVADTMLENQPVGAGSRIVLSPLLTHHDPRIYPDPRAFKPERWTSAKPAAYAYLPFGAGPRRCIGSDFASLVVRTCVAAIHRRVRVSIVPRARINIGIRISMLPRSDIPVTLHPQDGAFRAAPVRGQIHDLVNLA